jgi:AraC-like DNA-binding protein
VHYREVPPHPLLADSVRCFWTMERRYADERETVWPDGKTEIVFHYGARYHLQDDALAHGLLIGPLSERIELAASGTLRLVGIRFHPWGFYRLFGLPPSELTDRVIALDDLWPRDARMLEEQIAACDERAAIGILERFLLDRAARVRTSPLASIIREVMTHPWRVDIARLARRSGLSVRQFERRVRETVGLSPVRLAVIARFDAARRFLHRAPDAPLSSVAQRFGFYDYPHFARDVERFLGMTPAQLRARILTPAAGDVTFLSDEL